MRILAIDLGKHMSVACTYDTESCTSEFQKVPWRAGAPCVDSEAPSDSRGDRDVSAGRLGRRLNLEPRDRVTTGQHGGAGLALEQHQTQDGSR